MKVCKLGWSSVPGKRVALPSLLAGCLLGCANFSVVDANGRSAAWPSVLVKSEVGSAEANVPAQVPQSTELAAKPVVNPGRAQRAENATPTSGDPPVLTSKIRSKPKAETILQPVAQPTVNSAVAEEDLQPIDLVEEETQTTPPFALPAATALPVPAPVSVSSNAMTPPPFPVPAASSARTVETLTIPPPPVTVRTESVSAAVAKPIEPLASTAEMDSIEYLEEETPLEIVSADEFDAQLEEKPAPELPEPVAIKDDVQPSAPEPVKADVVKDAVAMTEGSDVATEAAAVVAEDKNAVAVASALVPGAPMDEEVVELLETDLETLRGVPTPAAPKSEQAPVAKRDPATPVGKNLFQVAGLRFCRQIMGFGQTEPLPHHELKAGHAVLLYAELANFHAEPESAGYVSRLHSRILLESPDGTVIQTLEFDDIEDRCESLRTDFFCHYTFKLPESLPTGSYVLRLKVKDVLGGEMAERTMDFAIGTPQLAKGR